MTQSEREIILRIEHITKRFPLEGGKVLTACDDVTFPVYRGEILGIVGESGCGKSTLVRTLMQLQANETALRPQPRAVFVVLVEHAAGIIAEDRRGDQQHALRDEMHRRATLVDGNAAVGQAVGQPAPKMPAILLLPLADIG